MRCSAMKANPGAGLSLLLLAVMIAACGRGAGSAAPVAAADAPAGFLIANVLLVDGSGAAPVAGAVRVESGSIAAVGDLEPLARERVIDGRGQVLAPGFIDTHSHAADDLGDHPDAIPVVSQGITTIIAGQDGSSAYPLTDFFAELETNPVAVNVASFAGHNTIRGIVMGDDYKRAASEEEVGRMETLLEEDLAAGRWVSRVASI